MVPESKAAGHGGGAEGAVWTRLIGHHQPTIDLPVPPAATHKYLLQYTYPKRHTIAHDAE